MRDVYQGWKLETGRSGDGRKEYTVTTLMWRSLSGQGQEGIRKSFERWVGTRMMTVRTVSKELERNLADEHEWDVDDE